jgi:hypothetical protein
MNSQEAADNAKAQAAAQVRSIVAMVAALEVDYDRLEELRDELRAVYDDEKHAYDYVVDGDSRKPDYEYDEVPDYGYRAFGHMVDLFAADDFYKLHDEAKEYRELEEAAGDCESEDEARERILEDALSVQVRSGWTDPGAEFEPYEFEILLCTGGPAVRIMGELDEHNQPSRAWIEYQDWGTPWTHFHEKHTTDSILTYCQQFYFGD